MAEDWVYFDEREDVVASTDLLALLAPKLQKQPSLWKWMIIAAHNGLQGAVVCAIKDSSATNILRARSAKRTLSWFETLEGDRPTQQLDDFEPLLKKYRRKYPCTGTIQQLRNLRKLHKEFRNAFAHFVPLSWIIEVAVFPPLIATALDGIEAAMHQHQVLIHLDDEMLGRLKYNLASTRSVLASMEA